MTTLKIIFAGTPEFAVPSLEALLKAGHTICQVYTQPDRPAGRGQHLHESPVKQAALRHGLSISQPKTLRDTHVQAELTSLKADVMIVVAYGLILPSAVLKIFSHGYGCINVHASLLPRWRGAAPIQRAILAGDIETGITIMEMDEGLDTGPMFKHATCLIEKTDTSGSLHDKLARLGADTLLKVVNDISTGQLHPEPQNSTKATIALKILKQDAKINWNLTAIEIERCVRAFNPWPMAFCSVGDLTLRIWDACEIISSNRIQNSHTFQSTDHFQYEINSIESIPGTILKIAREGIDVATGAGILTLKKIQLPGGKPLLVSDILNAHPEWLKEGNCFTNEANLRPPQAAVR
jgi:methionyl-tRNA formyltransferase